MAISDLLNLISRHMNTDSNGLKCQECIHFWKLSNNEDYGVCINKISPRAGLMGSKFKQCPYGDPK